MIVDSHMHVGGFPLYGVPMDRAGLVSEMAENGIYAGLAFHPDNVYLETSGMPMHAKIREAVERVGPDRVLYGSDTPFHHPSVELTKVRVSGLSTDLTDRVLGESGPALILGEQMPAAVA